MTRSQLHQASSPIIKAVVTTPYKKDTYVYGFTSKAAASAYVRSGRFFSAMDVSDERMDNRAEDESEHTLMWETNPPKGLVAFLVTRELPSEKRTYVREVSVHPKYRRKGLGRFMAQWARQASPYKAIVFDDPRSDDSMLSAEGWQFVKSFPSETWRRRPTSVLNGLLKGKS